MFASIAHLCIRLSGLGRLLAVLIRVHSDGYQRGKAVVCGRQSQAHIDQRNLVCDSMINGSGAAASGVSVASRHKSHPAT